MVEAKSEEEMEVKEREVQENKMRWREKGGEEK